MRVDLFYVASFGKHGTKRTNERQVHKSVLIDSPSYWLPSDYCMSSFFLR